MPRLHTNAHAPNEPECDACNQVMAEGEGSPMSVGLPGDWQTFWVCDDCYRANAEADEEAGAID